MEPISTQPTIQRNYAPNVYPSPPVPKASTMASATSTTTEEVVLQEKKGDAPAAPGLVVAAECTMLKVHPSLMLKVHANDELDSDGLPKKAWTWEQRMPKFEAHLKSIGATDSETWTPPGGRRELGYAQIRPARPRAPPEPQRRLLTEEEAAEWEAAGKPFFGWMPKATREEEERKKAVEAAAEVAPASEPAVVPVAAAPPPEPSAPESPEERRSLAEAHQHGENGGGDRGTPQ
jgi:hypothetical protein